MSPTRSKTCNKKYKNAETKLLKILSKIETLKLRNAYISQLDLPTKSNVTSVKYSRAESFLYRVLPFVVFVVLDLFIVLWWFLELSSESCILIFPDPTRPLFRPPEDCSMCENVTSAEYVTNITAQQFEELYAYNAVPVVITDAMDGWKALQKFSFEFFSNFYKYERMGQQIGYCSFFPYKSGFNYLEEVFDMDEKRANLSGKPWYVGWSTCYDEETRKLRAFYNRPYFLPPTSESDSVDWIFMGGPGQGAHMHVDFVRHKSWQAQVSGRKRWELAPPPECLYRCQPIVITVETNHCIVVDTNRWYHRTSVLPGDLSITIGAEYD